MAVDLLKAQSKWHSFTWYSAKSYCKYQSFLETGNFLFSFLGNFDIEIDLQHGGGFESKRNSS